jgi:predicted nucleotidyltransferase
MNLNELNSSNYKVLEVIGGSKLYGLDLPTSDTDIRGIFNLPVEEFILNGSTKQINDDTNDIVFYEIAKFLNLAMSANPNILELMFAPDDKILFKSDSADLLLSHKNKFLTKACKDSFGGYAVSQIKKARGLNKKIVNPCTVKKTPMDFCYVLTRNESTITLREFIKATGMSQNDMGIAKINNFGNSFIIYHKGLAKRRAYNKKIFEAIDEWKPKGIVGENSNELRLTSIPKDVASFGKLSIMHYNKDGYISHCKEYKEYNEWVEKRNPDRYNTNLQHGQGYDAKNMMHCFRLLETGIEIATTGNLNVVRPNRQELLDIRSGKFKYGDLIDLAEEKVVELDKAFDECDLPSSVSGDLINDILLEFKLNSK